MIWLPEIKMNNIIEYNGEIEVQLIDDIKEHIGNKYGKVESRTEFRNEIVVDLKHGNKVHIWVRIETASFHPPEKPLIHIQENKLWQHHTIELSNPHYLEKIDKILAVAKRTSTQKRRRTHKRANKTAVI